MTENPLDMIQKVVDSVDGELNEVGILPDGSGFATMSMPLPEDHWLLEIGSNVPPMPFRVGTDQPQLRKELDAMVVAAARYAIRAATMNGKEEDFDPDAMVQNFVVGMLGYCTPNALSQDDWENPDKPPFMFEPAWSTSHR